MTWMLHVADSMLTMTAKDWGLTSHGEKSISSLREPDHPARRAASNASANDVDAGQQETTAD
jgi:hypothetical protein